MVSRYLPESGESILPSVSGCEPLPTAKSTPTLPASYSVEWLMELYLELQSSPTSDTSRQKFYQASTSCSEDSHARTLALQELGRAWTESEPAYSTKQFDLFQNVNLGSCSSKTSPASKSLCQKLGPSLRRLATIAGMDSLAPRKSEQTISEIDGGFLPTPSAVSYGTNQGGSKPGPARPLLETMARPGFWPTPGVAGDGKVIPKDAKWSGIAAYKKDGKKIQVGLDSAVRRWPIPRSSPNENRQTKPTPSQLAGKHGMNLATVVAQGSPPLGSDAEKMGHGNLSHQAGGKLNPTWVEWLMGYPLGWTVLEDWAMQWFRSARKKRLGGS